MSSDSGGRCSSNRARSEPAPTPKSGFIPYSKASRVQDSLNLLTQRVFNHFRFALSGQIGISPDGDVLLVTEKGTNQIDAWTLTDEGLPVNGKVIASHGAVPFGFTFVRRDVALITEAKPSAVSSYETGDDGALELLSGTVLDNGAANCWIEATKSNRYAFVTNTGSGTISSYLISPDGSLSLLNSTAAITGPGTAPIDFALSDDSHFLFVRLGTKGTVAGFSVASDGSLTPVGAINGVPAGAQGLAAR